MARKVAVDLVEGDQAREEASTYKAEVIELKNVISLQDSLSIMKENENAQLRKKIELLEIKTQGDLEEYERINKELRKQSTLKSVFEVTTGITAAGLILALIFGGR